MTLDPTGKWLVIEPDEPETGRIVSVDHRPNTGTVVAVGSHAAATKGDRLLFQPEGLQRHHIGDEMVWLLHEDHVLGRIE
jgi:co-chaperonin GroES (HSP10)